MVSLLLIIPAVVAFLTTLFIVPYWIRKAHQIGLTWDDMNKFSGKKVAGSGGIIAILGFVMGILLYIAYRVFILQSENSFLVEIFASLSVILLLAGIGFIDDLLGWQKGGLSRKSRIILIGLASIPLIAINAGQDSISIPFLGQAGLGILYPLVLIPIGIIGATTTYNFLAGFNGLEAGQGVLILSSLSLVAHLTGNSWLSIMGLTMAASLLAFLFFNSSPAKVFPGDSLTYGVGSLIAIMAILGNFEKIAVFFFIPYIIETILKSRGRLKKHSFGYPNKEGYLDLRYNKIYSLNHVVISVLKKIGIRPTEKKVVLGIWLFQLAIIIVGFVAFRGGIFI